MGGGLEMRKAMTKEILFVTHSSRDDKGKRVIVRLDNTENTFYPGDETDPINKIMGLEDGDIKAIQEFFGNKTRKPFYPQREERLF